jgi:hypothetical protein
MPQTVADIVTVYAKRGTVSLDVAFALVAHHHGQQPWHSTIVVHSSRDTTNCAMLRKGAELYATLYNAMYQQVQPVTVAPESDDPPADSLGFLLNGSTCGVGKVSTKKSNVGVTWDKPDMWATVLQTLSTPVQGQSVESPIEHDDGSRTTAPVGSGSTATICTHVGSGSTATICSHVGSGSMTPRSPQLKRAYFLSCTG